ALVFKIRAEEQLGKPIHAKGQEDSPWSEESGYPLEYSVACQLVDDIVKAEEYELQNKITLFAPAPTGALPALLRVIEPPASGQALVNYRTKSTMKNNDKPETSNISRRASAFVTETTKYFVENGGDGADIAFAGASLALAVILFFDILGAEDSPPLGSELVK